MPASRRRSGEQENLLDDVPISIRRRIHTDSAATESRAPVVPAGTNSQPTESRASPLVESMERAGTTGTRLDMMSEGWNSSNCIFSLLTFSTSDLLHLLSSPSLIFSLLTISMAERLPGCAFPSVHIGGSLASKLPSIIGMQMVRNK